MLTMRLLSSVWRDICRLAMVIPLFALLTGCGGGGVDTSGVTPGSGPVGMSSAGAVAKDPVSAALPSLPASDVVVPRTSAGLQKVVITLRGMASKDADADKVQEALKGAASLVKAKGGTVGYPLPFIGALSAELPDSGVDALRADPRVAFVEPDLPVQCLATELENSWGVARMGCPAVFSQGNKGTGVRVAIIDTGIDYTHPDLRDAYAGGYDFYSNDSDPMDEFWHGTHVAGIVGARANDTGAIGVAPECRLYGLKCCGKDGGGSFGAVVAALQWCVDNKMQVANISLGSGGYPGQYVENACAAAQAAGVVLVAAAGNSGMAASPGGSTVIYPAAFTTCISVAAVDGSDNRAGFSSTGPRVDVAAPGAGIYSCLPGPSYGYLSGTSMASPHVAGVMALALKRGYTPAQARARLFSTALDLGAVGRDEHYGYGRVQADRLIEPGDTLPSVNIVSPTAGSDLSPNALVTFTATASDAEDGDLTSRVVWTLGNQSVAKPSFSIRLPIGTYTATATVTDRAGQRSSASVSVVVRNHSPSLVITSPSSGSSFRLHQAITFTAVASDKEDGDITRSIIWFRNGTRIGNGGRLVLRTLPLGTFTINAQVTDSSRQAGAVASVQVKVTR